MTQREWKVILSKLPEGLTFGEVARRIGENYMAVRAAIIKHGYPAVDGRKYAQGASRKLRLEHVDWSLSNVAIARQFNVSRELVRIRRMQLGYPLVESRGRPRKNSPASQQTKSNQTKCRPTKKQIKRSRNSAKS